MKHWIQRFLALAILTVFAVTPLAITTPASAQQGPICFSETPFCIQPGPVLDYWQNNGGLPVFGLPISDLTIETLPFPTQDNPGGTWTGPVQWFERDRLEDHSGQGQGVLAGLLGDTYLEMSGRPWYTFPTVTAAQVPAGCRFFAETGHSLCEPFLSYWTNNGGLMRFGYPITEPFQETLDTGPDQTWTGTVQYFQRRRMEYHPENRGTPYETQLGLLASTIRNYCPVAVHPDLRAAYQRLSYFKQDMGCPSSVQTNVTSALQNFERGSMLWLQLPQNDNRIYAYINFNGYRVFNDTWQEGDPDTPPDVTPPAGLYSPRRGFGKVWINNPDLRNQIGWALERYERAIKTTVQFFDKGGVMIWVQGTDSVYAFGPQQWQAEIISQRP